RRAARVRGDGCGVSADETNASAGLGKTPGASTPRVVAFDRDADAGCREPLPHGCRKLTRRAHTEPGTCTDPRGDHAHRLCDGSALEADGHGHGVVAQRVVLSLEARGIANGPELVSPCDDVRRERAL